ncbi:MAG: hypothetical protein AB8G11_14100 [Saprospiraceae bacterium]
MKTDKSIKFLLAVIAINLTLLTISELDLLPKAYANEMSSTFKTPYVNYGLVPLNPDSTITVSLSDEQLNLLRPKTNTIQNVNLVQVNGEKPCGTSWNHCFELEVDTD